MKNRKLVELSMQRLFDIVFSVVGITLFLPLFFVVAVIIKLDSDGPVFYKAIRTGRFGEPFLIFKFRTMFVGCEKQGGDTTALNDPRITKIGAFLRKHKIDELPQFINVLKGEMSIVGPRPELVAYTGRYTKEEQVILSVRPGITDYSSIEFRNLDRVVGQNDADNVFEKTVLSRKNALRIKYVNTRSFTGDLKIIFLTLAAIFKKG